MTTPCSIEWLTIPAPDLKAAIAFYRDVFGFTMEKFSDRFWVFRAANISGGLDRDLQVNGHGVGFSITVPDMASAVARVEQHGGRMLKAPYELAPGAGYSAKFADPNENVLELYAHG